MRDGVFTLPKIFEDKIIKKGLIFSDKLAIPKKSERRNLDYRVRYFCKFALSGFYEWPLVIKHIKTQDEFAKNRQIEKEKTRSQKMHDAGFTRRKKYIPPEEAGADGEPDHS
jgi:hypothetical protein